MALPVVFKYGKREQYDNLGAKSNNALYFLTDTGEIYHGEKNLARGSHYEGVRSLKEDGVTFETDQEVIDRILATVSVPAVTDDIFVVKTQIGTSDKYSHTAYVYDEGNWSAMDGNYDANNVYFDENMTVTENIGAFVIPEGQNSATLNSAGKSLKEVLMQLLAQELQPERVSSPAVSLTLKANSSTTKSYEVGTKVVPSWSASLSTGSYTYGPATGITATSWSVTDGTNTSTEASGKFPEITVGDSTNYYVEATAYYDDGAVPVTNLGNPTEDEDVQIKAGSATAKTSGSANITGYRAFFYGSVADDGEITSAMIRGLNNGGNYNSGKDITISAVDGAKRFIVAYSSTLPSARKGVSNAEIQGSVAIAVTSQYSKLDTTVAVEGKDGYATHPYTVWVYEPAKIAAGETHKVKLA